MTITIMYWVIITVALLMNNSTIGIATACVVGAIALAAHEITQAIKNKTTL